ncbi:Kelch domain-containing protein 7A [Bagarius yarrelli]|uniref:Kelch domain-containing protein 7A n=1 Tax=Bagarius yarrelli TaxID=175774 RepID=A0A556V615_BAGYA|nr:Kelch domain-containing protein 7A [Bagarius yarrelli]
MPEADLLGVHFDMQLLAKLTVSAAAILFVTWVFRFYSTRSRGQTRSKKRLPPPRDTQPSPETCRPSKTVLDPLKEKEANDGENRSRQYAVDFGHGIFHLQKTDAMVKKGESKELEDFVTNREGSSSLSSGVECYKEKASKFENLATNTEEHSLLFSGVVNNVKVDEKSEDFVTNAEGNPYILTNTKENSEVECNQKVVKQPEDYETNTEGSLSPSSGVESNMECLFKDTNKTGLNLMIPISDVTTIQSGRRSPCQLKKLDGGVEVGRELRQNMGHPGTFSSFQSKAEIKVENADLVIEGPGDQSTAVRGKIYEYFVETSSQSVSDLSPTLGVSSGYGTYEANKIDKPRTPSPLPSSLIIRDLEFSVESDKASDRVSIVPIRSETGRHLKHGFIRKDSYLAAAAESEVQIPFPPPVTRSHSFQNECSTNSPESPKQMKEFGLKYFEDPQVETVARAQFFHLPGKNMGNSELESLNGKLDLGNCLEALMLAKKDGHNALQQAALRVMSDNYFQVLRDPYLYGRLKAGERDQIQRQRNRGKRCLMVADMDSDWTWCSSQSADTYTARAASGLYYYDDYLDTWHPQGRIPQEVFSKGCAICTMDNYLFVAVGFQSAVPSKKVFCYNPMTSIWSEICPMNEARPHCKLVALQDHVYAIGGECLSTVERYDPRTNRWTFVAPLPNETFAVAHRATACNGELFVSGGTLKYTLLRYNPKNDVWRQSLIVGSKERTTEMIAVRNFLYRFDVNPNIGISVYRYHVVAKLWYMCCSKQIPYCHSFQCVAMDDIIYCVNRQFTMRFLADEKSPGFVADDLQILTPSKGILFPFVLSLPDKSSLQTRV